MREFKKIKIDGKRHPIRCNIRVLGEIQEVYGTIKKFEVDLFGLEEREKDGKKYAVKTREPSMEAVAKVLPLMVNEGVMLTGGTLELSEQDIVDGVSENVFDVVKTMQEEFRECFVQKKE